MPVTSNRNTRRCILPKVTCKFVKSTYTMHIYHTYSRPSVSDYLDTSSELAINLLTKIHHLTHSFRVANDNGFQFHGYPVGRRRINGNISIVMCLYYPPTHCIVERDLDIAPSLNLDEQLITNLMSMMHLCCPERPCHHYCCDLPLNLVISNFMIHHAFTFFCF